MASTQAEVEAPRNGPEMKDLDGPNTNGVDAQREMETNSSNGPTSTPVSNNGSHDMNESSKLQSSGGYYKPPVGYPVDSPAAGYENAQSGFGYPPHSYIHQQQQQGDLQQQGSYPYSQYPGSNLVRNVSSPVLATKPVAYMNSMPRPGVGPVPSYSPVHHGSGAAGGQGYPPSRYSTPTLNQLLQPGTGVPVQRYSYGDYPQQQPPPPNSHPAAGWPMQQQQPQQPRNFAPGFKPPPNSMQQGGGGGYPSYGPGAPIGHGIQQQRYALTPSGGPVQQPPPSQQEPVKGSGPGSGETSAEASNSTAAAASSIQRNSSSPSTSTPTVPTTSTSTAAVSSSSTPTTSSSTAVASPAVGRPPPAPSPASRSMSPALGPPNSNNNNNSHVSPSPGSQSDNNNSGPARMSHSPMAAQGAYQQPMPPPPHVGMPSYKMGGSPYQQPQQQQQQQPMHHPQQQPSGQPQQPQYLPNPMYMQHPRPPMGPGGPSPYGPSGPGSYGPQHQQPPPPPQQPGAGMPPNSNTNQNPMPPASPGPNRSMTPHMGPPTPYPGYPPGGPNMNQYGQQQQQQNWGPANTMPGGPPGSPMPVHGGKGAPSPSGPPTSGPRPPGPSHTPPHYMKQHLQHHLQQQQQQKMYGMASSPGPAPGPAPLQGPPQPPSLPQSQQPPTQQQQQQHMGPYPPPPGMNNASSMTGHPPSAASPVTNLVTTGPDGVAGLDEASQQSTLSNTSAASGDDVSAPSTPRSRKETSSMPMTPSAHHPPFSQQPPHQMLSHPPTPQSTVPSPGPASLSSQHEDYNDVHSPGPGVGNWSVSTRPTPSSPKTSHVSDALARMYDFDDHPDRRKFLDQLLRFMEEKGSPITACPTISKNPLDLFRLYLLVRDRGGFLEVTKNKAWKDIAQTLGIGASSSAAYTLRKHYTKSLFPWECKFDRGGVDPQPILNQVEATTKKKPAPKISVPSPAGSSNSQDSFPSSGVPPIPSMDGYPNAHYPGYPPPHAGENIAASNPFDDQQHYGGRGGGHPGYPPHQQPPPPSSQQQQQQQQQQQHQQQQQQQQQQPPPPPSMYNTMAGRPGGYPGHPGHPNHPNHPGNHPNQGGYHHPYQNEYPNPNNQQYPPYVTPPNRTMYSAPYPEPYNPQAPPSGQAPPPGPGPGPGPSPSDPYGRFMPPNHAPGAATASGPYPPRPPVPPTASTNVPTPTSTPSPSPATIATSTSTGSQSVPPSPLAQSMQPQQQPLVQQQQSQPPQTQQPGNTSAGPSPAPSPAPNAGTPGYPDQTDPYQRSGLRQLLASSTLLATPSSDRQPGYPVGATPSNLGPPAGQPYPGLIRPGTPGPTPSGMPPRQSTPTPTGLNPPVAGVSGAVVGPNPNAPPPTPGAPIQQQPGPGPYPPYGHGPPGQPNQPRQPSFDPYGSYRSPYGTAGSSELTSSGGGGGTGGVMGFSSNLATGWRNNTPYVNQYPQQGSSPGPVQTVGAPWVPPTGTPQPRNPAWDQAQRYPGPIPATPATTINGTSHQQVPPTPVVVPPHPMAQQQPQQQAQQQTQPQTPQPQPWPGPQTMVNNRQPFMGPRPPYTSLRAPDGKPYPMPPIPGKGPMTGPPGAVNYPQGMPPGPPANMPIFPAKRESYFPPDSVEAVVPVMAKRRRLCRADMVPVDAWRVYLALKSGLLAESTWAIDVLNVLLYDDSSIHYFSLAYMPGLTEVLLEHFRRCLSQIFTILEDMEIGFDRIEEFKSKLKQRSIKPVDSCKSASEAATEQDEDAWWNWPKRKAEPDGMDVADLGAVKSCDLAGERVRYLDGPDWSMNTRRGEKVGVVPRDKELFVVDVKKEWDVHDGFESGMDQWQIGGGDTTQHIVTHFTAELSIVPFVRVLKKVDKKAAEQDALEKTNEMECQVEPTGEKETQPEEPSNATPNLPLPTKNCLMNKPSRSLADVLKRIKKEDVASDQEVIAEPQPEVNDEVVKLVGSCESRLDETEIKKESTTEPTAERPVVKLPTRQPESSATVMVLPSGNRLVIRDPHGTLKRRKMDEYEDECYTRDESSLYLVDDSQDALARRALALSNIFRSLSFVPSNETELAKNSTLLVIVGKILLLHHDHPLRSSHQKNYDREEDVDFALVDSLGANGSASSKCETDWWWDTLLALRENVLVLMSNIAGQLDLSIYSEEIVRPVIDGLLHWAICPSAQSQDPFSSFGPHSTSLLSPQRLSLEALSKLMVMDCNMDLILATPPFLRLEKLVHFLTRSLCRTEDQVLREFAVNLLYYLSAADSGMARLIALHNNSLALLVSFVEQAEANALAVASQHGIQALRENPESMGTSLDMLRRAASTVFHISRHPESRPLLAKLEQRLLALVMSQIMDQSVAALLSKSLYLCNSDDE